MRNPIVVDEPFSDEVLAAIVNRLLDNGTVGGIIVRSVMSEEELERIRHEIAYLWPVVYDPQEDGSEDSGD